jgi:hypothetical protein
VAALTTVKIYKARRRQKATHEFSRDAEAMARDGWEVVSQSWERGHGGCLRTILVDGFVVDWVFPPKGSLVVTYKKPAPVPTPTLPPTQ